MNAKKNLQKISAILLALVLAFGMLPISSMAEVAADNIDYNVDFSADNLSNLDKNFTASVDGEAKDTVGDAWGKGENAVGEYAVATSDAAQFVNYALGGTVDMPYESWLSGSTPALLTDGTVAESGNNYVMSGLGSEQVKTIESTITFIGSKYNTVNKVQIYWRKSGKGIPVDFSVQAYNGTEWVTVASETNYAVNTSTYTYEKEFTAVSCNAIKIVATKLGKNGTSFTLEMLEVEAGYTIKGDNLALSSTGAKAEMAIMPFLLNSGHSADMLNDGAYSYTSTDYAAQTDVKEAVIYFPGYNKYSITDVVIAWRDHRGCPEEFTVEVFDGTEWKVVASETGYAYTSTNDVTKRYRAHFDATLCTAVKLKATKLGAADGKFALQVSEIEAYGGVVTPLTIGGTAETETWLNTAAVINDGKFSDFIASNTSSVAETPKTATVTFKNNKFYLIDTVGAVWRTNLKGVPTDFDIEVFDGSNWVTVASESNYTCKSGTDAYYNKAITPVLGSAVRLVANKLGLDGSNYVLEFTELQAWGVAYTNLASGRAPIASTGHHASWGGSLALLTDGDFGKNVTFETSSTPDAERNVTINLAGGAIHNIKAVNICFYYKGKPVDFKIEAYNGNKWVEIASETGYTYPNGNTYSVAFDNAYGTAVRLVATKLGAFDSSYSLGINEIEIYGSAANYLSANSAETKTLLTLNDNTIKNFKAQFTMLNGEYGGYALAFGQQSATSLDGAVVVSQFNKAGALIVEGVKQYSAKTVSENYANKIDGDISLGAFNYGQGAVTYAYAKGGVKGFNQTVGGTNLVTLNVEVFEGAIKVWYEGYEDAAWTALLGDDYAAGYISVVCSGKNSGGVKSLKLTGISGNSITANNIVNFEVDGKYAVFTINSDYGNGMLATCDFAGNIGYDAARFEYKAVAFYAENGELIGVEKTVTAQDGALAFNFKDVPLGTTAKIFFVIKNGGLDFNNAFTVEADGMSFVAADGNGSTLGVINGGLKYDYTEDMKLNVLDFIAVSKSAVDQENIDAKELVGIKKALLGIGGTEVEALCASPLDSVFVDESYNGVSDGTQAAPFKTLGMAYNNVNDGGTVNIVNSYSLGQNESNLGFANKSVTLTGGTLDISGVQKLNIIGDLTLDNLTLTANNNTIYANGNNVTVNSNVNQNGTVTNIFGGTNGIETVKNTNLTLLAGNYTYIYGGSEGGIVDGNTNLTIGGSVNKSLDITDHSLPNFAAAGSLNGVVRGNTNVIVKDNAKTSIVYGGGFGANSIVSGKANVTVSGGNTMGYYGGSNGGSVAEVNFVMSGGSTEQIFGANWNSNFDGNVNVTVSGGTVSRRIYGGCYNDTETDNSNFVNGTVTLTINEGINFTHSASMEYAICAASRTVNSSKESAILKFENSAVYNSLKSYIKNLFTSGTAYDELYVAGVKQ